MAWEITWTNSLESSRVEVCPLIASPIRLTNESSSILSRKATLASSSAVVSCEIRRLGSESMGSDKVEKCLDIFSAGLEFLDHLQVLGFAEAKSFHHRFAGH